MPRCSQRLVLEENSGAPSATAPSTDEYESIFLEQLAYIRHVVGFIVRRHALPHDDAQDFEGWVLLRLTQDDYAVLRKFKGKSKLATFLTTVIHNLHRDFRIQRWGKWRPSAAAARLGEVATQLESLLFRDHYGLEEAVKLLRENYDVGHSAAQIERLAAQLRPRFSRRFETERALVHAVAPEQIEEDLLARERSAIWSRVHRQVRDLIEQLDVEDRVILRLRFEEGLTVAAIARELMLDQRKLYARLDRLLRELRESLEAAAALAPPPAVRLAPAGAN